SFLQHNAHNPPLHSFPTRRSSDLSTTSTNLHNLLFLPRRFLKYKQPETASVDYDVQPLLPYEPSRQGPPLAVADVNGDGLDDVRSEEHTSELQSLRHLVCRLLLEK